MMLHSGYFGLQFIIICLYLLLNINISLGTAAIPNTGGVRSKDDMQSQHVVHSQPSVNPQPSAGPQPGVQSQPDEHAEQTKFIAWSREIQQGKDLKCFFSSLLLLLFTFLKFIFAY